MTSKQLAIGNAYRLFARLWFRELERDDVAALRRDPLAQELTAIGLTPPNDSQASLDELAADFCQLFLGPKGHRPAVQSVWTSGQFQGRAADSMQRYVGLLAGVDGLWKEARLPDHLGVQLDVMGAIMVELAQQETDRREPLTQLAGNFFRDHLNWTEPLTSWAPTQARTSFYAELAEVTRQFLAEERAAIG